MAKRQHHEINAGSMADIAFLLLIFFLVTTTMEVDAGISRHMPLKNPDDMFIPETPIHERDILKIETNSKDQLFVENETIEISELEEIAMHFYTINLGAERDKNMPAYKEINLVACQTEIAQIQNLLIEKPYDQRLKKELNAWKTRLAICNDLGGRFFEIAPMALVRIENQSGTTYGLYIEIQNILKRVVNNLREEKCRQYYKRDFYSLDENNLSDQLIIEKLRILVPERVIDAKIER